MEFDVSPQTIVGAVGTAIGTGAGWVWTVLGGRISKVERSNAVGLDRVETRVMTEIRRVEEAADESFRDLWNEITQHREAAHKFRESMSAAVAALPTRDEMERIITRATAGHK